ncbi:hypothetical protein FQA39_LY03056 [Lamprigera yunnana]|nr:hypothetical protein FQA39_LY03056 [Lamprigera yunnana]
MKLMLLVIVLVFELVELALIPPSRQGNGVRRCMKRIIDVYGDGATTVFFMYGVTKQKPGKELVFVDITNLNNEALKKMGVWRDVDYPKRKYVYILPIEEYNREEVAFHILYRLDVGDAVILVHDYHSRSDFTEVVISDKLHSLNKCGTTLFNRICLIRKCL